MINNEKKTMKKLFSIILLMILIISCTNYTNKDFYEVTVGNKIEIYITTNSCCFYCFNNTNLTHTEFIEVKRVENGSKDCEGCNWTDAYIFEAKSEGIDTIILEQRVMIDSCSSPIDGNKEQFVIKIREK